jgi:methionyl-tRNA formyltransferase
MRSKNPRIVFMGTPDLAAWVLQAIINDHYPVAAVVTAPDRPAGRGRKIQQSPVKQLALAENIPVLQPENLKSPDFINQLQTLKPDIQVVVAFRMLPEAVWSMPPKGTFNLHASLLPDYRGAAPINWAIINGEKETGVTTFLIDHKIDTGNILLRKKIDVSKYETAGSLHEKIKTTGASLVLQTIKALTAGSLTTTNQNTLISHPDNLNKAPKIFKEDCRINWNKSCEQIVNLIHGLSPQPGAFTHIKLPDDEDLLVKIFITRPEKETHHYKTGTLITDNKNHIRFAASDGFVNVLELQIPGKRRMHAEELLRGFNFPMEHE